MTYLALFPLTIVALSATAGRWTRLHPLLIAMIAGIPGALIGFLIGAATMSEAVWYISAIGFVVTALVGALGAFFGWLRRDFVKRNK